jgi:5-methylcytosine-specific restriction endonuclease McrA
MKVFNSDPELVAKRVASFKQTVSDPDVRLAYSERARKRESDPDRKMRKSASLRETYSDPEIRKQCVDRAHAQHQRPDAKERHRAACLEAQGRPETKLKKSESLRRVMKDLRNERESRIANSLRQGGNGDLTRIDADKVREFKWRNSPGYVWQQAVKSRDGFKCQSCGSSEDLHAHHIKQRARFPELALDLDNGTTLCRPCHLKEHNRIREEIRNNVNARNDRL